MVERNDMEPGQLVETYKFWEVAALWARERLENELVVARSLARGIVVDGLRFQSVDPRHQLRNPAPAAVNACWS